MAGAMLGFGSLDELLDRADDDWLVLEEAVKQGIRRRRDEHDDLAARIAQRIARLLRR